MVSADNLNLDVLEEIFSHLPHGPNLASVALVSRSFLEAVVPRLYASISFRLRQAKKYPETMSPFGAMMVHPELAAYVRNVDIFAIPQVLRANKLLNHPAFIRECADALKLCYNLMSFKTTVPGAVTYFFPSLNHKPRLEKLSLYANLTIRQSESLLNLSNIKSLEIQSGSWSVADALPRWTRASLHRSLRHLTLYMVNDLNEEVLEATLSQLSQLRSLHVIGCPNVDHNRTLRVARYTPLLESLSMTVSELDQVNTLPPSELSHIRTLALDARTSGSRDALSAIFTYLRTAYFPLVSFKLKNHQKKVVVAIDFIKHLVESHGHSLQRLSFLECDIPVKATELICKSCPKLERLDTTIPTKDLLPFGMAVSHAKCLRVIVDVDNHAQHGPRAYLTHDNIDYMMDLVPSLKTIIDGNRIWTCKRISPRAHSVILERRPTRKTGSHWFMPQEI